MTPDAWLLLALILVGAAWLVIHVVTTWQALRSHLTLSVRLIALVPPAAPVIAWKAGRRTSPMLWLGVLVCYAVLRMLA